MKEADLKGPMEPEEDQARLPQITGTCVAWELRKVGGTDKKGKQGEFKRRGSQKTTKQSDRE